MLPNMLLLLTYCSGQFADNLWWDGIHIQENPRQYLGEQLDFVGV